MLQLSISFIILASQISNMQALPLQLEPDPAAIQPSVVLPTASPPTTIPAFPEQSAVTSGGSTCPLDLSDDLIAGISASCSPRHRRPATRARCCPSLAAGLYSAYAASTLTAASYSRGNLPELPDDSESCASAAERAITARGVELPRVNTTCGAAYCYCGIRLRRLSCSLAAAASGVVGVQDKWAPPGVWARKLKKDCALTGLPGCSHCLKALNELKGTAGNGSSKDRKSVTPRDNDCQLMGLTWLLSKNRTRYLQTATAVLRAFMTADSGATGSSGLEVVPACHPAREEMPIAVGSSEIGDDGYTDLSAAAPILLLMGYALLYVVVDIFVIFEF